jgi:DNA-binding transcriptional LysR family regulator
MTALRLADDFRMLTVASPAYLRRQRPPSQLKDLHQHNCIRYRLPWDGTIQPWIFNKGRKETEIAVEGSLIVNDLDLQLSAALDGLGVTYMAEPLVAPCLAQGTLVAMLEEWSGTLPGVFLYYPSRRQTPVPLRVFLDFIKKWRKRQMAGKPYVR